jgi:hypothetical protein
MVFTAGCRRDPCDTDATESDDPIDLGQFSDQETRMELPLTLHTDTDVDVFSFDVIDQGSDGNPQLYLWATGQDDELLTLSVNFQCADNDPMESFSCDGFEQASEPGFCTRTGRGEQHPDADGGEKRHAREIDGELPGAGRRAVGELVFDLLGALDVQSSLERDPRYLSAEAFFRHLHLAFSRCNGSTLRSAALRVDKCKHGQARGATSPA